MAVLPQKPTDSTRALGAGLTFAAAVALFAFAGSWLDNRLSTSPWFVLVGTLLGILGGAIHVIHHLAPGVFGKSSGKGKASDRAPDAPGRSDDDPR